MSRYVDKKHGLTIGSDNIFFVIDRYHESGAKEIRDGYNSIVSFRGYTMDRMTTANFFIQTPAVQLCWRKQVVREMQTFEGHTWPRDRQYWTLAPAIRKWLDENVGAFRDRWDTYTQAEQSSRCLFFKRRKDALAFCKMIDDLLAGIKIGEF